VLARWRTVTRDEIAAVLANVMGAAA
jgi:hypothetical protein